MSVSGGMSRGCVRVSLGYVRPTLCIELHVDVFRVFMMPSECQVYLNTQVDTMSVIGHVVDV